MRNLFSAYAILLLITVFASCGEDEISSCEQSNFVGTYTIVGDSICSADNTITGPQSFFLTAGSTENTVLENGEEDLILTIVDCEASDDFVSYSLDGENLTSTVGDCSWTYKKN